jgi:hypothetical protein
LLFSEQKATPLLVKASLSQSRKGRIMILILKHSGFLLLVSALFFHGCDISRNDPEFDYDPVTGLRFISVPGTQLYHNDQYMYSPEAEDKYGGEMIFHLNHAPDWLTWSEISNTLSGIPTADNVGEFSVSLSVANDKGSIDQAFIIKVQLKEVYGGSWYHWSRYKWPHDGKPDTNTYCIIYTDGAHEYIKQKIGSLSDQLFEEVLTDFNFDRLQDFHYPPDASKIHVFINRFHEENIAAAFWGCYLITIRTQDITQPNWQYYLDYIIKH